MSTLPNGPQKSFTAQEVDAWLLAAQEQRARLHLQAAQPWPSLARHEAFTEMSALLQEALEEVRVVSAQLREHSQATLAKVADLQERSARLIAQGATCRERPAPFAPPSPEEVRQAERRLLEFFKPGEEQRKS
jgi:signal transduction histidine kinase